MLMQGNSSVSGASTDAGFGSFTVVDVETSGLRAAEHRVLSVAALTLDAAGRVSREFHTLLDPGCDPGPVHVHGLTREVLRGSPSFDQVREQLSGLLTSRVMVAHNAGFDYGFLAREFDLSGAVLPVDRRLCTLALARRVSPPTPDCKLGTLATYYGIPQSRAHDALDDARVLAEVLRALIADAARLGVEPPLLSCPPKESQRGTSGLPTSRSAPKQPCLYRYPGRLEPGGDLVQGMKVAITGSTATDRGALIAMAESAGLEVTTSVSKRTSLLVSNSPQSGTSKARKAIEHGTPVVAENRFLALLDQVRQGQRKDSADPSSVPRRAPTAKPESVASGPLTGHRVLVLGGSHEQAAAARVRIGELGGSAVVNMSARVTDVLALPGAAADRRFARAVEIGIPVHGPGLLETGNAAIHSAASSMPSENVSAEPMILARGQVIDLPVTEYGGNWTVRASWTHSGTWEVDLVAFLLDSDEQVSDSSDFVFYNQPDTAGARLAADGPNEQTIVLALDDLPDHCRRIVIAAALDGPDVTFGDVGAIEVEVAPGTEASPIVRATLDAATEERTLLLGEIYQRGDDWRLRAVGQGYASDLAALARRYGVEVDD